LKKLIPSNSLKTTSSDSAIEAIEFSNNGILDSLTGAPAPKLFFDNLAREISQSRRNSQAIAIVTIKLQSKDAESGINNKSKTAKKQSINQISQRNLEFEKLLAQLNNNIKSNMRGSDFYSRIAENGFWLCLQGDLVQAISTAKRFEAIISQKFMTTNVKAHLEFSSSEWTRDQDINKWISEIDQRYFAS
jgi:GGDEF domain-containing protein